MIHTALGQRCPTEQKQSAIIATGQDKRANIHRLWYNGIRILKPLMYCNTKLRIAA